MLCFLQLADTFADSILSLHTSSLAWLFRLHALLQEEEEQLLWEMEAKHKEATAERQVWMREQVNALRGKREEERKRTLAEKNEQLFR